MLLNVGSLAKRRALKLCAELSSTSVVVVVVVVLFVYVCTNAKFEILIRWSILRMHSSDQCSIVRSLPPGGR